MTKVLGILATITALITASILIPPLGAVLGTILMGSMIIATAAVGIFACVLVIGLFVGVDVFDEIDPFLSSLSKMRGRSKEKKALKRTISEAKKILKRREVSPLMLEKLKSSVVEWKISEKEFVLVSNQYEAWAEKGRLIDADINEHVSAMNKAKDPVVKTSYPERIEALKKNRAAIAKKEVEANALLDVAEKKREELLTTFRESAELAESFKKSERLGHVALEHQSEIKGLLEQSQADE